MKEWVIGDEGCPYRFVFRTGVHEGMVTLKVVEAATGKQVLPSPNLVSGFHLGIGRSIGFTADQCKMMVRIFASVSLPKKKPPADSSGGQMGCNLKTD